MLYYEVLVASSRYHGTEPLTYAADNPVAIGSVVKVPLQRQQVLGIVSREAGRPDFPTKPLKSLDQPAAVPPVSIRLLEWLQAYYPAPLGMLTQLFLPPSLAQKARGPGTAKSKPRPQAPPLPPLTPEQQKVVKAVTQSGSRSLLLHGDTGTGKTRVYLELAERELEEGKSVIVLTPEIGLTPQLVKTFELAFPGRVITVHSTLTPAQRRTAWRAVAEATGPLIIIGPRSALFSPVKTIGLIVLDEAHDSAYKQEQTPYYQTSRVAAKLTELHDAKLLLGSATPSVNDYYAFKAKGLPIMRMQAPASGTRDVKTEVVNLRERGDFTRSAWLSDQLLEAIQDALRSQAQSLVFLNRRGSARLVVCQACGWQALCPRCDLPLTYHGDLHALRCHTCGYNEPAPAACPVCASTDIVFKSIGTKALLGELQTLFPKARIMRFDSDTLKSERLEQHYEAVRAGEVDILVGTQMLSKGLDLPGLACVGVVVADTSLYFPDYTAEERTYQMLNQVLGRVGRGHRAGYVCIQTYQPDSLTIRAAIHKDYESFYERQIAERQLYRFPPFCHVLKLTHARASQAAVRKAAESLAQTIRAKAPGVELVGPAPAFVERVNNKYRWQLVVKAKQRRSLLQIIELLPANWSYDIDPSHLL